jgi:hypothetical protein
MPDLIKLKKLQKLTAIGNPVIFDELEKLSTEDENLAKNIDNLRSEVDTNLSSVVDGLKELDHKKADKEDLEEMKRIKLTPGPRGDRGERGVPGFPGLNGVDGLDGKDGRDGLPGVDGEKGEKGEAGKDGSPDTPEEIKDKLENLPDKEKLAIEAIRNLRRELDELKKQKTIYVGGGGNSGGRIVKSYDLSSQLNGVTKTFNIPAVWRVIDVKITHPAPLRENVDYTWTQTTITFTSEIDATTYLSSGQSVIIIYSE